VKGCSSPFVEDTWSHITFLSDNSNKISMKVVKPCARCKIPTIEPGELAFVSLIFKMHTIILLYAFKFELDTGVFDPTNEPSRSMRRIRSGSAIGFKNEKWQGEVRISLVYYSESFLH
jgi:hypothetical protein